MNRSEVTTDSAKLEEIRMTTEAMLRWQGMRNDTPLSLVGPNQQSRNCAYPSAYAALHQLLISRDDADQATLARLGIEAIDGLVRDAVGLEASPLESIEATLIWMGINTCGETRRLVGDIQRTRGRLRNILRSGSGLSVTELVLKGVVPALIHLELEPAIRLGARRTLQSRSLESLQRIAAKSSLSLFASAA